MNELKHTPGPWISAVSEKANRAINIYAGSPFIDSTPVVAYALPLFDKRNERDANALLIAAAPDLLAALKALVTEIRAY